VRKVKKVEERRLKVSSFSFFFSSSSFFPRGRKRAEKCGQLRVPCLLPH
jgi:hypothetical protein